MRYLSMDIEATGLDENCLMIELAFVPFDTETKEVANHLSFHSYVHCPSFEELKPTLNKWVVDHNKELINKAHQSGKRLPLLREDLHRYLGSPEIQSYFKKEKIVLFGKSMNAIDLPFLDRDLGWEFMRGYFQHRQLDLSSAVYALIDLQKLPKEAVSGSKLMKILGFGEVAHTALEDAQNTAIMYLKILDLLKN